MQSPNETFFWCVEILFGMSSNKYVKNLVLYIFRSPYLSTRLQQPNLGANIEEIGLIENGCKINNYFLIQLLYF